jgi:hypothetical protein
MFDSIFPMQVLYILAIVVVSVAVISLMLFRGWRRKGVRLRQGLENAFGAIPQKNPELASVCRYWDSHKTSVPVKRSIDDRTWDDLEMDEIFARIDACQTSVGEECLYARLHELSCEDDLSSHEPFLDFLASHPKLRLEISVLLSKMGKSNYNSLYQLNFDVLPLRLRSPFIYPILACLPLLFLALCFFNSRIGVIGVLLSCFLNGFIHYYSERRTDRFLSVISYFSVMLWSTKRLLALITPMKATEPAVNDQIIKDLEQGYEVFKGIRSALAVSTRRVSLFSDFDIIQEFYQIIFLTRVRKYNRSVAVIYSNRGTFRTLYQAFGELDTAVSLLSFRKSLPHSCVPEFLDVSELDLTDVYHPLLKEPVMNTLSFKRDCLISGSNASGKSTFLKTIAINAILAQTIHTCTAQGFRMRPAHIVTSMATHDSIVDGESYFIAEIRSLKRLITQMEDTFSICVIDEILKGTNTIERIAASAAVLRECAQVESLCLVATHDIELTTILEDDFDNLHFEEQITDEGIVFDYKVKQGPSDTRNAIALLEAEGFNESLVCSARDLVTKYEQEGRWM